MFFAVLAAFTVIFSLSVLLLKWYSEKILHLMTHNRHEDSDFLIHSGMAPISWKKRTSFRLRLMISEKAAHRLAMKRLNALANYFTRTPLVDSEESRITILQKFSEIKERWSKLTWQELFPPESL